MEGQERQRQAQLGATFCPGGPDDFYMPEVFSPSPQRITSEVPGKISDKIAHLEIGDAPGDRLSRLQSLSPVAYEQGIMKPSIPSQSLAASDQFRGQAYNSQTANQSYRQGRQDVDAIDQPTFSPFPPLRKRPANVPPSDEEREATLESARTPVLNSDDPGVQLRWAQDTLVYVEIAAQNEARISENEAARPRTPRIKHQLRVDALNVVSFLADQHHPKAEFIKGMWLEFGKFNFRVDKKEAFRCYQRAAQKGYARAEYRMGMQFESYNDPEKAIKHYRQGVRAGDSASHYRLGMMTLRGQHGQRLDYVHGVKLISYAAQTADQNAPQAAYVFGMLQAHELAEINVPEEYLALNISAARFNIEKAAYLGFAKAQAKMGAAYELCQLGCDFNPALSLHYNALAARQGEPEADMAVSKWFLCGYEGLFEKNEELAFTYAQRAAQSGLPTAEFALGYFFEIGIFVSADLEESRSWYEKAAHHGNKDAVARIEGISRSKTLSRKDHENVAVAKIKSQYGSHRGKRPERFKNPSAPMPTIPDSMPEPELPRQRHGENSIYSHQSTNGSITPYPVDDGQRRPPPRAMNEQSYTNPGLPSNSISRPNSAAGSEVSFLDSNYRGSAYPTFQSQPHTSGENGGAGRGRGAPVNGPSGAQGPQGYRKPTSGYNSSNPPRSPPMDSARPQTPQPPAIDIGFSAPPDPRRQQRFDNPNLPTLGTLPGHPSNDISTSRRQDRLSSMPHPQTTYHRTDSPQRMPNSLGRQGVSLQDTPQRPDSAASLPNISSRTSKPDAPAATPPPSTPAARPPGKGPKTFQEMGVPATKNESDCMVM